MKSKKLLRLVAILSILSLTFGSGACNAPIFNLNVKLPSLSFLQSCTGVLPNEENQNGENNETENFAEVSQYFKYTLNEDGQSYSVGFWNNAEEFEEECTANIENSQKTITKVAIVIFSLSTSVSFIQTSRSFTKCSSSIITFETI